jgi:hypothetical protein
MTTNVPNITRADAESLATKLFEFGRSLPAPEQALLWAALSNAPSGSSDEVQGYTIIELVSPDQLRSMVLGVLRLDAVYLTGRWK